MDFINDRIAIGNRHEARDLDFLKSNGIGAVLNLAYGLNIMYHDAFPEDEHRFEIEYHKVGLIDGNGNKPSTLIAAVYVLDQLLERHDRVLVHCFAGISRSSTVVATYLSQKNGMNFEEALNCIKERRPEVEPRFELREIAKSLPDLF